MIIPSLLQSISHKIQLSIIPSLSSTLLHDSKVTDSHLIHQASLVFKPIILIITLLQQLELTLIQDITILSIAEGNHVMIEVRCTDVYPYATLSQHLVYQLYVDQNVLDMIVLIGCYYHVPLTFMMPIQLSELSQGYGVEVGGVVQLKGDFY